MKSRNDVLVMMLMMNDLSLYNECCHLLRKGPCFLKLSFTARYTLNYGTEPVQFQIVFRAVYRSGHNVLCLM